MQYDTYRFLRYSTIWKTKRSEQLDYKVIGGGILDSIYRNKVENFSYLNLITYPGAVFFVSLKIINKLLLSFVSSASVSSEKSGSFCNSRMSTSSDH